MKQKQKKYLFFKKNMLFFKKIVSIFVMFFLIFPVNATFVNINGVKGDFVIENDNTITQTTSVILNINLSGITQMKFGNTPLERDNASWENYSITKSWSLTSGNGKKTVYAAFKDTSGNIINIEDDIIYKQVPSLPFSGGLTLWLDAMDSSTITSSGADISKWSDKSSNAYHASQTNNTNQATLLTDEVDFNGTSDYFYLENINYTSASPLDGLFVCTVFKTTNQYTGITDNWAFLDFDRSEWFNFYNRGDGIGLSYDAGGIQDIYVSGAGVNDNSWHIACASYDNSVVNDTEVSIDGQLFYSQDLEPTGSQIGVGQATRYGFVGDGSEASTQNGSRNSKYYNGSIGEIIYFDSPVNSTNKKDIECYLAEKWNISINSCPDNTPPIASINYSPEDTTSDNVVANLTNLSENITITNNSGSSVYTFNSTGSFLFEYIDNAGNTGSTLAKVDWIDPQAPSLIGNGNLNEAPTITSYSGASSTTIHIASGAIQIANIDATDTIYNVVGEYGHSNLTGNTWQQVNTHEMCNPVVTVSHRQLVDGEIQRAPRVRNKTSTGFEIHVDNYDSSIGSISTQIDYMILNAGVFDFGGGLIMEAGSQNSSVVACATNSNPTPTAVNFLHTFNSAPVVAHTISTENDTSWVVSGVNGNNGDRGSEPSSTGMGVLLQRSFNSCTHQAENVDYIAIEPGNYTLVDGSIFDATRSSDSVGAISSTGYPVNFLNPFSQTPKTVLTFQLGEDGGNGGYSQIHNGGGVLTDKFYATIDEDGPGADRSHTTEVVSSIAFDKDNGYFLENNTLSYSISGGADSTEFNINQTTGELSFNTAKTPTNFTDANSDGIYEVVVSVCDSHCNSKCSTQTILADTRDLTAPIISSTNISSGSLLPGGNHNIIFNYSDEIGGSGINTNSGNISLYKWDGSIWGADISSNFIGTGTLTETQALYPTLDLDYGKYKVIFSIADKAGNISLDKELIFYIDRPEIIVSSGSINMGNLLAGTNSFSPEITITVKTVGAGYTLIMNKTQAMLNQYSTEIVDYNGTEGFGYDKEVYSGNITKISTNEILGNQSQNINTNGFLNSYTYKIKTAALINYEQAAGDYETRLKFGIELNY